jgi:hypothetical protein
MLDSLLTMTLPLLITLVALPLLARLEVFRSVDKWEKLAVTLSVSTVTLIMALSFWATLLPAGFRAFSLVVYAFGLCSCLWSGYENREFLIVALRGLPRRVRATFRGDKLTLVLWTVIAAYLAKACLFLLFRPIVDADVVDSYLPFARTLYLSDHIPLYNYFDTRPIMVPPVGGWILYGWAYSLSGSMFSESFRLLMLPILIGNLVMTYLLGRTVAGEKTAKLGLIIFAFLPFQDQLLFEFVLYPDMMFAFLSLVVFYLLVQLLYQQREPHEVISYTLIMGLAMGGALLLKFQGVFLYYFLVLFYLLHYPCNLELESLCQGRIPCTFSLGHRYYGGLVGALPGLVLKEEANSLEDDRVSRVLSGYHPRFVARICMADSESAAV